MNRREIHLIDPVGRRAVGYIWQPDGPVSAVVQISHGMEEHILRYERFAAFLCDAGFAVIGSDHPGHGVSTPKENLGYFDRQGYDGAIERLHTFTKYGKDLFPHVPYFLLGHSMGSFMVRAYCARYGVELDGAVFMGTSGPNPAAAAGSVLVRVMALFKGWRSTSPLIEKMMFGTYNKRFEGTDPNRWLSKDDRERKKYADDDRCGFPFTLDGYETLLSVLRFVSRKDWAKKIPKDLPVLLVSGAEDPVGQYGAGVRTVARRLKEAGVTDVRLILYPTDRHELLNETDRDRVQADLAAYFSELTARKRKERHL